MDDRPSADETDRLWVFAVDVGGPADTAGIEPGDEIRSIEGQGVAGLQPGNAAVLLAPHNVRAGQDVSMEIDRNGLAHTILVRARPKEGDVEP